MHLDWEILKKIIFCLIFWFVKNSHLSENLRKTAEISAPSIFQGIQFFFWNWSPEAKKNFLSYKITQVFAKKIPFFMKIFPPLKSTFEKKKSLFFHYFKKKSTFFHFFLNIFSIFFKKIRKSAFTGG